MRQPHPLAVLLCLTLLTACQTPSTVLDPLPALPAHRANDLETAALILEKYHHSLRQHLTDRDTPLDHIQIFEESARFAQEHLAPHADALHRGALQILAESPRAEAPTPDRYEPMFPALDDQLQALIAGIDETLLIGLSVAPGLELATLWDPRLSIGFLRALLLGRLIPIEDFARITAIDSLAPMRFRVIDPSPETPTVALIGGQECFVVNLRYIADRGFYTPRGVQWWRLRGKPASAPQAPAP